MWYKHIIEHLCKALHKKPTAHKQGEQGNNGGWLLSEPKHLIENFKINSEVEM